jgi:hypothetical protein
LVENALTGSAPTPYGQVPYDARADAELCRLLAALDQRLAETSVHAARRRELSRLADACAAMLQAQTRSAETFAQLVARAHRRHDFLRIGALADIAANRFTPAEICEVVRHPHPIARALGHEALVHLPTAKLAHLLADPGDAALARYALERQALDYGSEEAHEILYFLDDDEGEYGPAE